MNTRELLRAQRILGLTNEELAETLGFHPNAVSRWRRGQHPVPARAADRITELMAMPEGERERHVHRNTMKYRRAA